MENVNVLELDNDGSALTKRGYNFALNSTSSTMYLPQDSELLWTV
jgi:hypothetical protein